MIHRFWKGDPVAAHTFSARAIKSTQYGHLRDWTPETLPSEMRWACDLEDVRDASNRIRYMLLRRFGGLWLDSDVVPLQKFPTDRPWTAALDAWREGCAIYFPEANHPMTLHLCEVTGPDVEVSTSVRTSGAELLNTVGRQYPNVGLEPRILPFDALGGRVTQVRDPLAVHLWASASMMKGGAA